MNLQHSLLFPFIILIILLLIEDMRSCSLCSFGECGLGRGVYVQLNRNYTQWGLLQWFSDSLSNFGCFKGQKKIIRIK